MKKIFWLIVLVVVWYWISIFLAPAFADKIANLFWFKSFNEQIRWSSDKINKIATDIPSVDEMQKTIWNTVYSVKDWIDKTKKFIDDTRITLSWAEDTLNKAKDFYSNTLETVDKIKWTLGEVEKIRENITWTVNTEIVK